LTHSPLPVEFHRWETVLLRARFIEETKLAPAEVDALSVKDMHEWFQIRDAVQKAQATRKNT
jgi:hypothetical protein